MKILIIGNGWVGNTCLNAWDEAVMCEDKIHSTKDALAALEKYNPDVVLNAAGVTGKPNVDWCEDHQMETIKGNTLLPVYIAEACAEKDIYMLHIGSGCIFYGESSWDNGEWRAEDFANPTATYSRAKYAADLVLTTLPNVGIARIRMPLDSVPGPRNLITKLANYPKVIDVENSATVFDDMIDILYALLEKKAEGPFHVVNKGTIKHKEIMELYRKYVDPNHTCEWISNEDLVKQGLATKGRSNNFLDISRVEALGIEVRDIKVAVEDLMKKYAELINE